MTRSICFFMVFLQTHTMRSDLDFNFVVWDVGQGAWSTFVSEDECWHFDMGGEKIPWPSILKNCRRKQNRTFLTHEDWDHISEVERFFNRVAHHCLYFPKPRSRRYPRSLKDCPDLPDGILVLSRGAKLGDRNSSSIIYLLRGQVLITGDAPMKEEKKWVHKIPTSIRLLLLGHHGSHTSTSIQLLQRSQPQMAIASARKSKYGHPHLKVLSKLKKQRVPALDTETLGNLYFKIQ